MSREPWKTFKFIDLFAGIGGIRIPFEELGGTCVFTSEWDKHAQKTYEANFGELPCGDITKVAPASIPDHDVLLAGFPCQAFSIMGKMKGFDESRGTLFFNVEMILREKQPSAFLLENVKQLRTHDNGRTFEVITRHLRDLGYHIHTTVLNALNYGVPQKRERTFIVGFKENLQFSFPKPLNVPPDLKKVLEPDHEIDPKLVASDAIKCRRMAAVKGIPPNPSIWHENKAGNISALPYSCALRTGASYNYLLVNGIRRLSSRELLRLQGFPETFKIAVSHGEIRRQTGNSVAVPVIRAVARQMLKSLRAQVLADKEPQQMNLIPEQEGK